MWTVGSKKTMTVGHNPEANFPLSLEFRFHRMPKLEGSWGMWFDVSDAWYLVRELLKAIAKQTAVEHRVHLIAFGVSVRARLARFVSFIRYRLAVIGGR